MLQRGVDAYVNPGKLGVSRLFYYILTDNVVIFSDKVQSAVKWIARFVKLPSLNARLY